MKKLFSLILLLILPLACRSEINRVREKIADNPVLTDDQLVNEDQPTGPVPRLVNFTFNGGATVDRASANAADFSKNVSIFPGEPVYLSCSAENATNGSISFTSNNANSIGTIPLNATSFPNCNNINLDTTTWVPGIYNATFTSRDDSGSNFNDKMTIEVKPRVEIRNVRINGLKATIDLFYPYGVSVGKLLVNGTEVPVVSPLNLNQPANYTRTSIEVPLSNLDTDIITAEVVMHAVRGPDDIHNIKNNKPTITSTPVASYRGCSDVGQTQFNKTPTNLSQDSTQGKANWVWTDPAALGTASMIINQVTETVNSSPSAILSNSNVNNTAIEGYWKTTGTDNDFWGVVFGYQKSHFYLFDWKGGAQNFGSIVGATSPRIRKCTFVSGQLPFERPFWNVDDTDCFETKATTTPAVAWRPNQNYKYDLQRRSNETQVRVWEGDKLVVDMKINEATPGDWGIYAYSQASSIFWNLKQCPLPENKAYTYTVAATDPENHQLTYQLPKKPDGMVIDSTTGRITWAEPMVGKHHIVIQVTDGKGGVDSQFFTLKVI